MKYTKEYAELIIIFALSIVVFFINSAFDTMENILEFCRRYEKYELDEIMALSLFYLICVAVFAYRRWQNAIAAQAQAQRRSEELEKAMSEIRRLKEIIPICAVCHRIRNDQGYWNRVEEYIESETGSQFSHGLCPDCMKKQYPELYGDLAEPPKPPDHTSSKH